MVVLSFPSIYLLEHIFVSTSILPYHSLDNPQEKHYLCTHEKKNLNTNDNADIKSYH